MRRDWCDTDWNALARTEEERRRSRVIGWLVGIAAANLFAWALIEGCARGG